MKKYVAFTIITGCCLVLQLSRSLAQNTPEAFVGMIPALPTAACAMNNEAKDSYLSKISDLSDLIKAEITRRNKEMDQFISGNKEQMQENVMSDMGLSPAEMAKMKSGKKMSQAEVMAMAEKVMKNKFNMSMGEAKNLSKMSEDGKQAWGEAYGAEMMADAQANPEKYKGDQGKSKQLFEWVQEKKMLTEKHLAMKNKFLDQFKELENDTSENKTLRDISRWTGEWSKMVGVDYGQGAKMDALAKQIKAAKISYCNKLTPKLLDIYQHYFTYIKENLPDFYRMEELEMSIMEAQTKVKKSASPQGLIAMEMISDYVKELKGTFRYSILNTDDKF